MRKWKVLSKTEKISISTIFSIFKLVLSTIFPLKKENLFFFNIFLTKHVDLYISFDCLDKIYPEIKYKK